MKTDRRSFLRVMGIVGIGFAAGVPSAIPVPEPTCGWIEVQIGEHTCYVPYWT